MYLNAETGFMKVYNFTHTLHTYSYISYAFQANKTLFAWNARRI